MKTKPDRLDRAESPAGDILGEASTTVDVPVAVAFESWRHLKNPTAFIERVSKVEAVGIDRDVLAVGGPLGMSIGWEVVTTRLFENETISWKSAEGSEIDNRGSVSFTPAPSGGTDA